MAIRYGCFFSYAHGHHAHMNRFKTALIEALKCYLEPTSTTNPRCSWTASSSAAATTLTSKIARALCESVCMVLLHPKYEAHGYTRREFAAMQHD